MPGLVTVSSEAVGLFDLPTYSVSSGTGTTSANQPFQYRVPVSGPGYMPIIYNHGFLQTGTEMVTDPFWDRITTRLAGAGFPCISGDMCITGAAAPERDKWGNSAGEAFHDDLRSHAIATWGADPDTFAMFGLSAGAAACAWYVKQNLAECAAFVGVVPCINLLHVHDDSPALLALGIDYAYTDHAGFIAAEPTHSAINIASAGDFDGLNSLMIHGATDTVVRTADVSAFAALVGDELSYAGGHGEYGTYVNPYIVSDFVLASYPATAVQATFVTY